MTVVLAFFCFLIAAAMFLLRAAFDVDANATWAFFFISAGLAFACLAGVLAWGKERGAA